MLRERQIDVPGAELPPEIKNSKKTAKLKLFSEKGLTTNCFCAIIFKRYTRYNEMRR